MESTVAINHQICQFPDQKSIPMLQSQCFDEQGLHSYQKILVDMLRHSSITDYAATKQTEESNHIHE
jgi:hypothetical protein